MSEERTVLQIRMTAREKALMKEMAGESGYSAFFRKMLKGHAKRNGYSVRGLREE